MDDDSDIIAGWVAEEIMPWEGLVRNWLRRQWGHAVEVEDILQEAYCRIASLKSVDHIVNGKAYFFTTVQSVALDSLRRAKTMGARDMTEMDWSCVLDEAPRADQVIEARQELRRVVVALGGLSQVTREVIELRRLHGLSQKETARRMGIAEHAVENHMTRGLRKVLAILKSEDVHTDPRTEDEP
ncbi:MAG TPA: RNA polymerase subunit sigma-24 [Brevundimonas sp.]|nr:RNA polymerase subunit sigma-24 [Brevundimonas sp.]